jgi:hypothetical protein
MVKATMPKLIEEIKEAFVQATGKQPKAAKSPGAPNAVLEKHEGDPVKLNAYRSITGKLLYYATKIGPDLSNAVRELASHLSSPGEAHWKALERCVGYLCSQEPKKQGMIYRRPKELRVVCYADADYAKCPSTRRSISGGLCTVGGTVTAWFSRKQPTVALSSSEAEYISYATCCQETMFQNMMLEELLGYQTPTATIYEDNQGCIFLVKNQSTGQRTKHVEVKLHFSREQYEMQRIEPVFCRSEEQYADGMTKNQAIALFLQHMNDIKEGKLVIPCYSVD